MNIVLLFKIYINVYRHDIIIISAVSKEDVINLLVDFLPLYTVVVACDIIHIFLKHVIKYFKCKNKKQKPLIKEYCDQSEVDRWFVF